MGTHGTGCTLSSAIATLLGPQVLGALAPAQSAYLTGRQFFPRLISGPFADGLTFALGFAAVACLVAAVASALRGGKYHHVDGPVATDGDATGAARPAATQG